MAHHAVWNVPWPMVTPCQHPVSTWRPEALWLLWACLAPGWARGPLSWSGTGAWLDFHKGCISNGLIQNDSFQSSIISSHCSNPVLRQFGWEQGSIYVAAGRGWGGLITTASLINSNWKKLTLGRTKPVRDQLTKEDECPLWANVGGWHIFRRLTVFLQRATFSSSFRENISSFRTICVIMRLYQLIASSLLICVLLLVCINDTNSVCTTAQDNYYYFLIIFSHAELKILLFLEMAMPCVCPQRRMKTPAAKELTFQNHRVKGRVLFPNKYQRPSVYRSTVVAFSVTLLIMTCVSFLGIFWITKGGRGLINLAVDP